MSHKDAAQSSEAVGQVALARLDAITSTPLESIRATMPYQKTSALVECLADMTTMRMTRQQADALSDDDAARFDGYMAWFEARAQFVAEELDLRIPPRQTS